MGIRFIHCICMVALPVLAGSCIFDDISECPASQYVVQLSIKDINYKNVAHFPQLKANDEHSSFHHSVGTIYYILSDMVTGKRIKESTLMAVNGEERTYPLTFTDIAEGEYVLTVWGNIMQTHPTGVLHPDNKEYTDVYMASRTFKFDNSYRMTELPLERTKGLLLLFCYNFPTNVTNIKQNITSLHQSVNEGFHYSGSNNVEKQMPFQPLTATFLAPSSNKVSHLKLGFYTGNAETEKLFLELPDMQLTVRRNEISSIAIDYNKTENVYEIWTFIYKQWTMIHRLSL